MRARREPVRALAAAGLLLVAMASCTGPGSRRSALPESVASPVPSSAAPTTVAPSGTATSARRATSAPAPHTGHRQVTFVNAVSQTIWLAAAQQTAQPALPTTGWVLPPGQHVTINVPDHWNGRFWARTGCRFDASGHGRCQTGDCAALFQCHGSGAIPATLAEFNLNAWQNLDFYDVSMVDGANLPMYINIASGSTRDPISSTGCSPRGCARPVDCPSALQVRAGGGVVGCGSACGVFGTDQYCCRGPWASRAACDPTKWPVNYAAVFKRAQPYAYSYPDDDATSTFTCTGECGYRITFGSTP
jgi:Thaumatin family